MKTNKISDVDFIAKYEEELSYRELSLHFGIAIPTVQLYVKRLNLQKREIIDEIDKVRFTKMWNSGCSLSKIGRKFGLCGTTISRIARKLGLKERKLTRPSKQVMDAIVSEPHQEVPKPSIVNKPEAKTNNKLNKSIFIVPTLKQLEKQKLQAEIAKAEREYRVYKRECGYTARKNEIEKLGD